MRNQSGIGARPLRFIAAAIVLSTALTREARSQAQMSSGAYPAPATAQELRVEIEARSRAMVAAFERGDLKEVARHYTDDARLMGPGGEVVQGRAAIDAYWTGIRDPKAWTLNVLDVGGSRDEAWQLGESILVQYHGSGERVSRSRYLAIWKRGADGKFRIAVDFYHF